MRNELRMGRKVSAAIAFSAAVMLAPHAQAMSELEELMGEPVEALSDNELSDLRGGFVTVRGVKFNIGVEVSQAVNGEVLRRSTASIGGIIQNRFDQFGRNVAVRRREDAVEQIVSDEVTEVSVGGAPQVSSSSVSQAVSSSTMEASTLDQTATLTDDTMSFATGTGTDTDTTPDIGSTAASLAGGGAGSLFDVQVAVVDANNSNVLLNRVINLDIANYSVIDAMAARARVESKISSVVNSQVLFSLGQQF